MGTGSYNCKELVFSMNSEKVFAGWTGHLLVLACTVCCRRQCVQSSFNPISQNIMSWERDIISWERDNHVVGTRSYFVGTRSYIVGTR